VTSRELLGVVLRRWYLVLAGAALSFALLYVSVSQPTLHWTQFEVLVLPPVESVNPNNLQEAPYGITPMAGLLVAEINDGNHPLQMASSGTTLYGEGLRSGWEVEMRNVGSQWQPVYDAPVIDVQVVDPDPDEVARRSAQLVAELDTILRDRQDALGVRAQSKMTLRASPADPVVYEVGGSRSRAALAAALLGGSLTVLAVAWVDRLLLRRRRSTKVGPEAPTESDERRLVGV
jgi:hypothetical protein